MQSESRCWGHLRAPTEGNPSCTKESLRMAGRHRKPCYTSAADRGKTCFKLSLDFYAIIIMNAKR